MAEYTGKCSARNLQINYLSLYNEIMHLLKNVDVKRKTVFLRVDLDVPLSESGVNSSGLEVEDDTRLKSAMPSIEYLLKQNAKIVIAGHLGRPEGVDREFSLEPVAKWFGNKFPISNLQFSKRGDFDGWEIGPDIFLLENLRFNPGEEANDPEFSKKLAGLADVYVNDAFAMCHRNHASIVGITKFLPHFAGLHLEKEIENLGSCLKDPKRPLIVIIGGVKIDTKLPLVEKMHYIADYVLVGGKIADETKTLIKVQHERIQGHKAALLVADLNPDGTDITQKDAENFLQIINLAGTIIWNGSMGIVGGKSADLPTEEGTKKITEGILKTEAYTVVGGGDTLEYLNKLGVLDKFSFASTGGGAMLSFLSGEKLPGIEALT
jgi:phosphoglycerate kinase